MRDYLSPFKEELYRFKTRSDTDVIDQAVLTWKALYFVVHLFRERHPDWHIIRLEDLAADPQHQFRQLYDRLGLRWDSRVEEGIGNHSASSNPAEVSPSRFRTIKRDSRAATSTWLSRLNTVEVARVHAGVGDVGKYFYSDAEWRSI